MDVLSLSSSSSSSGEASHPDDYRWLSDRARRDCPIIEYCGGTELGGAFISCTVDDKFEPSQFHLPAFGSAFDLSENNEVMLKIPSLGMSVELLNHDHEKVNSARQPSVLDSFPFFLKKKSRNKTEKCSTPCDDDRYITRGCQRDIVGMAM